MKVELHSVSGGKLCFIKVNRDEALALINSLTVQMLQWSPNVGRLESPCIGQASTMTIAVMEEDVQAC